MENLEYAFKKVKSNKGSSGIDSMSISQFEKNKEQHLREIQRLLKNRKYKPLPVKRVYIPKPDGNKRPLGIPTIRDRIVQQALLNVFERFDVFESKFLDCSFGFRISKNAHQAIEEIERLRDQGYKWVVDADIEKFFDTVNHKLLMRLIEEEIVDGSVLKLIRSFLNAGVLEEHEIIATREGTPQGGVISPLLANIYLHPFDVEISSKYKLIRYADDFLVLCKSEKEAKEALMAIENALLKLKLALNANKTRILHFREGVQFLGFEIFEKHKVPRKQSVKKFKDKIRWHTRRQQPKKTEDIILALNKVILGWGNYFKIANVNWLYKGLDQWIRMRLRSFIEKKKSYISNRRIPNKTFYEMGLVTLSSLIG